MLFFTLISSPTLPPLQVRFKSVAKPFLRMGKNETCIDFGWDLEWIYIGGIYTKDGVYISGNKHQSYITPILF